MCEQQRKRPSLPGRDSSGKKVDILNEDSQTTFSRDEGSSSPSNTTFQRPTMPTAHSSSSFVSSPTPDLIRSGSSDTRDSDSSHPATPPTPMDDFHGRHSDHGASFLPDHLAQHSYPGQQLFGDYGHYTMNQTGYYPEKIRDMYEDDSQQSDKGPKRYPCKFAEREGCTKTFTTSGHASRHSKIHTAEKSILCEFPGCNKKFTRKDNMRQHYETHSKEKDRPRKSQSSHSPLTRPAGIKKPARQYSLSDVRPAIATTEDTVVDPQLYTTAPSYANERCTPVSPGQSAYSVPIVDRTLSSRPVTCRMESALDVLANAANYSNSR
ncbi:hypothetical protein BP6252_00930 [Coleophoma cylindrospora]|uniref:C2H2 type master regulator of conidiophore development brlA n=1 Tax=Coleophoma cylindrospora TaxID=1849047 RepID=A0A3D8ST06_9HELO|nr:hypothetical protein BP6252_00930 [Coleophoma cylindrospora]